MKGIILAAFVFVFCLPGAAQDTKIEVKNSSKSIVVVGSNNVLHTGPTVNKIENKKIVYHFSNDPKQKEILGFLNKLNDLLGVAYIDSKYEVETVHQKNKIYFIKNLETGQYIYLFNLKDHVVVDLHFYATVLPDSSSGLHIIGRETKNQYGAEKKYGFMNNKGEVVIKPLYDQLRPFGKSGFTVGAKESRTLLDRKGTPLFTVGSFVKDMIEEKRGQVLFVDQLGIGFLYDAATNHLKDANLFRLLNDVTFEGITSFEKNDSLILLNTFSGDQFVYRRKTGVLDDSAAFKNLLKITKNYITYISYRNEDYIAKQTCAPFKIYYKKDVKTMKVDDNWLAFLCRFQKKEGAPKDGLLDSFFIAYLYHRPTDEFNLSHLTYRSPQFQKVGNRLTFYTYGYESPFEKDCLPKKKGIRRLAYTTANGKVESTDLDTVQSFHNGVAIASFHWGKQLLVDSNFLAFRGDYYTPYFDSLLYSGLDDLYIATPPSSSHYESKASSQNAFILYSKVRAGAISLVYDSIGTFQNEFAVFKKLVKNKVYYGFLNRNGEELTSSLFEAVTPFNGGGSATVIRKNKKYKIDKAGAMLPLVE